MTPEEEIIVSQSIEHFDKLPDAAFVDVKTVAAVAGVSVPTIWRGVRDGRIPAPRKLSQRCTRWNCGELRRAFGLSGAA